MLRCLLGRLVLQATCPHCAGDSRPARVHLTQTGRKPQRSHSLLALQNPLAFAHPVIQLDHCVEGREGAHHCPQCFLLPGPPSLEPVFCCDLIMSLHQTSCVPPPLGFH